MVFVGSSGRAQGRRSRQNADGTTEFKSKNLDAERRRRKKLNDALMALRGVVPTITKMTRPTILDDAITYIQGLQEQVEGLGARILELEEEASEKSRENIIEDHNNVGIDPTTEEIDKCSTVEAEVKVTHIGDNKLLIKIICEKKRGGFCRLMEAMNRLGFETTETNFTSFNGAALTVFCVEGKHVEMVEIEHLEDFLLHFIQS